MKTPLSAAQIMTTYANLANVTRALDILKDHEIIGNDERIRLMRKFMDDRPAFKDAVQAAIDRGIPA